MTGAERSEEVNGWIRSHLFDEVPVAISVIGRDYRIVEANRQFSETYGPWRGLPCYEVYKGRSEPCLRCAALETFVDGKIRSREERGIRNGRAIDYLVHMAPVVRDDGDIPYVIEMSTDITPVKRMEREKRESERLAAVGETVAGVAHGIKNILMGLEGGMYAVNTGIRTGDDDRIARGWTTLEQNVERISTFTREFLDFAKGRPPTVTLADPAEPARQVVELYGAQAEEAGVHLDARIEEGLEPAPLDANGIHTCLANLVSNALDACTLAEAERDFEVVLTLREETVEADGLEGPEEPEAVETASESPGTGRVLVYEVADNGRGMDYEISRKVFSKFFTTKGSDRGTGLGLLTTKRIVHQHGGRITFTSEEGEGSVFRIELPREALPEPGSADGDDGGGGSHGDRSGSAPPHGVHDEPGR